MGETNDAAIVLRNDKLTMPPITITRLSLAPGDRSRTRRAADHRPPFVEILKSVYKKSEFIGSMEEIIEKIRRPDHASRCLPFGAYLAQQPIGFFCIDFAHPDLGQIPDPEPACWLNSFMIAPHCRRKGLATRILNQLPIEINRAFPKIRYLNLTVNFRNRAARQLYLACGFKDTGEVYRGGPAGPQHVFTKAI